MKKDTDSPNQRGEGDQEELQMNENKSNLCQNGGEYQYQEEDAVREIKVCLQHIKRLPYVIDPTLIQYNSCPKTIIDSVNNLKNGGNKFRNIIGQLEKLDEKQYWMGDIISSLLLKYLESLLTYQTLFDKVSKEGKNSEQVSNIRNHVGQNENLQNEQIQNKIRQIQNRWSQKYNQLEQQCNKIQQQYKKRQIQKQEQQKKNMKQKQMEIKQIYNQIQIKIKSKEKQISQLREQLKQREEYIDQLIFKIRASKINSNN